jgi:hypothetical protein
MEIEVKVTATTEVEVDVTVIPVDGRRPGPVGPRYRFVFSDDLVLERIDGKMPGGLPQSPHTRRRHAFRIRGGLRVAAQNDLSGGQHALQYEGTFMFDAVTPTCPPSCREVRSSHEGWPSLMAASTP